MSIGKLSHVAIATLELEKTTSLYRDMLGARVSAPVAQPEHGVTTVFVELPGSKVELLSPLGEASPIVNFLKRHPEGAIHHICFEVADIKAARDVLTQAGARALGEIKTGAHGKPVLFLHPKDFGGVLIELEQA
jgi:methylmalonyl-CoA/ethylmalonyl-CoA epimerase